MQIVIVVVHTLFLSTLSLRRATSPVSASTNYAAYFYPRSPCGERPIRKRQVIPIKQISIHALLAESDWHHWHNQ